MNNRVKNLWVAALESGEYKQGRGRLRKKDRFCCLGVLCDLYNKETGKGKWIKIRPHKESFFRLDNGNVVSGFPPNEILEWAGLKSESPVIIIKNSRAEISGLNDENRYNFKRIASLINEQL